MKKVIIFLIALVLVASLTVMGIGCKPSAIEEAIEDAVEEVVDAVEEAVDDVEEAVEEEVAKDYGTLKFFADKPWPFEEVFAEFTAATGVPTEVTIFSDVETFKAAVKTGISGSEGADVFTWWSNFEIMDLQSQGLLYDLTPLYEKYAGKYPQGMLDSFSVDGKVYGIPTIVAAWIVFYSLPVFEKYGLEEPETWDDFIAIAETLKTNDVIPIAFTIDGGWTSFIWWQQHIAPNYPDLYFDVCEGKAPWDSPEVVEAFEVWKDMLDKGYYSDPGLSFDVELPLMLSKDQAGMILIGDWYSDFLNTNELVAGEDYSIFALPPRNPDRPKTVLFEAGPIVVSANTALAEEAEIFVDWWLSVEGQQLWSDTMQYISANSDVDPSNLPPDKQKIAAEVWGDPDAEFIMRFWESTIPTINFPECGYFDKFILDTSSYMTQIEGLQTLSDTAWEEYNAKMSE